MTAAAFIAGDWGTTHLRLMLCAADGAVLDSITGPGVSQVNGGFAPLFGELTAAWTATHGRLPAFVCGMVGSSIGWQNVPYTPCPAAPSTIAGAMVRIADHDVHIAPGLSCRNRYDAPDVMRGEETQILGALNLDPRLAFGRHLLCLPGTHTKWVVLEHGEISEFMTSVTGELFSIVNQHSVLVRGRDSASEDADQAFLSATRQVMQHPEASLNSLLFECRSRQVAGNLTAGAAPHFLSGLLIACDCVHAIRTFADAAMTPLTKIGVTLIGTAELMRLHALALTQLRLPTFQIDGAHASLAGLTSLYQAHSGSQH